MLKNDLICAALKGIIEGLTEFIPISSTGHLIIVRDYVSLPERLEAGFDIFIQLGAILAVAIYFRQRLWNRVKTLPNDRDSRRFAVALCIGFIPAGCIGLLIVLTCHDFFKQTMMQDIPVAAALIAGGIIMVGVERMKKTIRFEDAERLPLRIAFYIGLFQCLSLLFPGASRSGATIVGALLLGISRTASAEFSFFLALPTLFAATGFSLLKLITETALTQNDLLILAVGLIFSFISGWLVIGFLMRYLRRHTLSPFGFYRIVLGLVVLGKYIG